jgi:hypothetical protein
VPGERAPTLLVEVIEVDVAGASDRRLDELLGIGRPRGFDEVASAPDLGVSGGIAQVRGLDREDPTGAVDRGLERRRVVEVTAYQLGPELTQGNCAVVRGITYQGVHR